MILVEERMSRRVVLFARWLFTIPRSIRADDNDPRLLRRRVGRMIMCYFECQVDFQERICLQPIKRPDLRSLSFYTAERARFASPIASDLGRDHAFD
jgi:hypothetical protein